MRKATVEREALAVAAGTRAWSAQQQAIFSWFATGKGNLVVRARAGTGKTTTILEGLSHATESQILLCAFNKRIAEELTSKLRNPHAEAKTLHGIGNRFVSANWRVRVDRDRGGQLAAGVLKLPITDPRVQSLIKLVSKAKGVCPFPKKGELVDLAYASSLDPESEHVDAGYTVEKQEAAALQCMKLACENDGTIDFDDMIFVPLRNDWVRGAWDLVVVDEAQDMNHAQLLLAQKACKKGGRIAVVGDDRQAIYGFRGADSNSIDRLKKELGAVELGLNTTYRCARQIVALATELVPDYRAAPNAPEGTVSRIALHQLSGAAQAGDFVLSRANAPLASVCLSLLRAGKRAKIQGRDIGSGLVKLIKKMRAFSLEDFQTRLTKWETRECNRLRAVGKSSAMTKLEFVCDQADTLRELSEGLSSVEELSARVLALFADVEGPDAELIVCSTVHRAKGLEADQVFLLENTFYRSDKAAEVAPTLEEENIRYVAVTRAKSRLVWVWSSR